MKNNKHCKRESQLAHQFNANPIQLILGLCVILGVSAISVRANDNPAQAAARVALEQKIYELDHAQTLPLLAQVTRSEAVVKQQPGKSAANSVRANDNPAQAVARVALEQKMYELDHAQTLPAVLVTLSQAVVKQPGKSAANVTATVSEKAVTLQTAPASTTPMAAPAIVARAVVAPAAVAHHMFILMLACFILSVLLLLVLLQHSRRGNSNQDSISSGDYNSRTNPFTLRLKTGDR
jgi:competence protein ComGC